MDANPRLRTIVVEAKANNMPAENIDRAISEGTGELPGVVYEEITYEGYGPGGVALIIETLTDNKNRTVGEIVIFSASMRAISAAQNSVAWMFSRRGQIVMEKGKVEEDDLSERCARSRCATMVRTGRWNHLCRSSSSGPRRDKGNSGSVQARGRDDCAELPCSWPARTPQQILKLMEALEDHDDVQHVWSNFDIEEKEMEASLAWCSASIRAPNGPATVAWRRTAGRAFGRVRRDHGAACRPISQPSRAHPS